MVCTSPRIVVTHKDKDGGFNYEGEVFRVPCGKCFMCKKSNAQSWFIRLLHEWTTFKGVAQFVTLTYGDNVPTARYLASKLTDPFKVYDIQMVLNERDVQLFFKRLRKRGHEFKYLYCGEYGKKNNRPHYHLIIFGKVWNDLYVKRYKEGKPVYCSNELDLEWYSGEATVGDVTEKSIKYVCGYVIDKLEDKREHLVAPYIRCSKGIGYDYVLKNKDRLIKDEFVRVGKNKVALPRYYRNKLGIDSTAYVEKLLDDKCNYCLDKDIGFREYERRERAEAEQREAEAISVRKLKSKDRSL